MITSEWPTAEHPEWAPFIVRQVESLQQNGIQVEVFHFRGGRKLTNYLRAWFRLQRKVSTTQCDLIHAQWGQSALLALPKRLPLVVTFRGSDLKGIVGEKGQYTLAGRILSVVSRFAAYLADEVVVVSEQLAHCFSTRAYHVIPSGVDLTLFRCIPQTEARQRVNLPQDKYLILFAANPDHPVKRFSLAQAAVEKLTEDFSVELVTTSNVPHVLMPDYMNACDALLLTSMHEGSPNVVKEALACNLPVVAVDVGDVRQRLGTIEGCVVCADDSPETIAQGLAQVVVRNQRVSGRDTVRDLDERLLIEKLISVYEQALSKAGAEQLSRSIRDRNYARMR